MQFARRAIDHSMIYEHLALATPVVLVARFGECGYT